MLQKNWTKILQMSCTATDDYSALLNHLHCIFLLYKYEIMTSWVIHIVK
jgi:hypothetical protein